MPETATATDTAPPKKQRRATPPGAAKAARETKWAPGCPPPTPNMDVAAFDAWRESMSADARKRCRGLYLYRKEPAVDLTAIQPHGHLEVLDAAEHPLNVQGIVRRHGGGKYKILMGYSGTGAERKAYVDFVIDPAEHPPIVDARTLKLDEPVNREFVARLKREGVLDTEGNVIPTEREEMRGVLTMLAEKATSKEGITAADLRAAISEQQGGAQKELLAMFGPILGKLAEASLAPREPASGFDAQGMAALLEAAKPPPPRDDPLMPVLVELLKQRNQPNGGGGMSEAVGLFKECLALAQSVTNGGGERHWTANLAEPIAEGLRSATAYFQMRAAAAAESSGPQADYPEGAEQLDANPLMQPAIDFLEQSAPVLIPMIKDPERTGGEAAKIALPYFSTHPAAAEALLAIGVQGIVDCFDQAPAYGDEHLSESRLRTFVGEFIETLEALKKQAQAQGAQS